MVKASDWFLDLYLPSSLESCASQPPFCFLTRSTGLTFQGQQKKKKKKPLAGEPSCCCFSISFDPILRLTWPKSTSVTNGLSSGCNSKPVLGLTSTHPVWRHPFASSPGGRNGASLIPRSSFSLSASPSVTRQTQEGPSLVAAAVRHMRCPNPSCVCCRYGRSPRQITDAVEEVTRASFCWGVEGKMSLLIHPRAGSASGTVPCLSDG